MEDEAHIEDLSSRNGTTLNGVSLQTRSILTNGDRIRIGAHDLVFVEETYKAPQKQRPTGIMVFCKSCGAAFSEGVTRCPHCGAAIQTERTCRACGLAVSSDDLFCKGCGTDLTKKATERDAPDIIGTWKAKLVLDVLEKAMNLERFDQAASIFRDKSEQIEALLRSRGRDTSLLNRLSQISAVLASHTKNAEFLTWVIARWNETEERIPQEIFDNLITSAQGWYDLRPELESYLDELDADITTET